MRRRQRLGRQRRRQRIRRLMLSDQPPAFTHYNSLHGQGRPRRRQPQRISEPNEEVNVVTTMGTIVVHPPTFQSSMPTVTPSTSSRPTWSSSTASSPTSMATLGGPMPADGSLRLVDGRTENEVITYDALESLNNADVKI